MTAATGSDGAARPVFAFGDFVLDAARYELRRGGRPVPVEPKVLELLVRLVSHHDRVVTRDELFEALWPGQRVGEESLNYCIKAARRAVGDSGDAQHTIATVRGHGYRCVADVLRPALPGAERHVPRDRLPGEAPAGFFVGREPVMARLRGALVGALAGQGRIALLVGEPGIGKTRTAEELARGAALQGVEVLLGRCSEGAGVPPFWPWSRILRSWVAARERKEVLAAMADSAVVLAPLVPDLAPLVGPAGSALPETDDARFRLFDAATRFLVRAAETAPLVLVLDDLHCADAPSLLLLRFLAREMSGAPMLVIATVRDTEVTADHPLNGCLAELARTARLERIALEALTPSDVGLLIEAATGELPAPATASALHRQTGGNPFFVTEMVRLLAADWSVVAGAHELHARVPGSVRDFVRHRLRSLSPETRGVLHAGAVFGQEFEASLLFRIPVDGRRAKRAALLRGIDEAVRAHLVEPQPGGQGAYRFVHALVRETIYDDLATEERVRLHGCAGAAIAAAHAGDPGPHLAVLAHHFGAAAVAGNPARAIDYAIRAGERAARMLAWEGAAAHFAQALSLLERETGAGKKRASRGAAERHEDAAFAILFALGENLWKSGELAGAKDMFRRAAERARAQRSATRLARAALGFGGGFRGFELGEVEPELLELLEEALHALPRRSTGLRARVMSRLAVALYHVPGSLERRQSLSQEAVRMAGQTRDTAAEIAALYARHGAIWGPDTLRDRLETAGAMLRLAERVGDREAALHAHRFHFIDSLERADLAAVEAHLQACVRLGEELRQPYYVWYGVTVRAIRHLLEGRLEESERWAEEALAAGRRAQSRNVEQVHVSQLLWIRREQGRLAEIEPALHELAVRFPMLPVWSCAHVFVLAELGRKAEAREGLEALAADDFATIARDAFWLSSMCALGDVCAEVGDADRARVLYPLLEPYRGRIVQVSIGAGCLGAVDRVLGRLAALLQRWSAAARHFDEAARLEQRFRAPVLAARTQRQRAAALPGVTRPARARRSRTSRRTGSGSGTADAARRS